MATLGGYYLNVHRSQYDPDSTSVTRIMGCGPTTGANGANASTGGKVSKTGQQIHNLVPRAQESDPSTLGWSLADIDKAVTSLGVPFENRTNSGWAGVIAALNAGYYVGLQGDSDRFGNNTCSGAFDGDHIIGIHPATRVVNGLRQHWIDDPICPGGRWEYDYIIRRYAAKLAGSITAARFGVFTHPVPRVTVNHYHATVIAPTSLWNGTTNRWVYSGVNAIRVGTALIVRGAGYTKGGVLCYPCVTPYPGYYVPKAHVRLGTPA